MKVFLCLFLMVPAVYSAPLPEGVDDTLLMQTSTYLYRWVMDEHDVEVFIQDGHLEYWVKELFPELDEGDESRLIEVWLPQLDLQVLLRKADYEIPKLNVKVHNKHFKVINVFRGRPPDVSGGFAEVRISYEKVEAFAEQERENAVYPEGEFLEALRVSTRNHLLEYFEHNHETFPEGPQLFFLSPLCPVTNELWVFWQSRGMLLRLSSDIDLEDPALWQKKGIDLRIYDLETHTVIHLNEVKGSNTYMTRDQVGRYLFNCIVLGKKMRLPPSE